jgi:hypothetical protein
MSGFFASKKPTLRPVPELLRRPSANAVSSGECHPAAADAAPAPASSTAAAAQLLRGRPGSHGAGRTRRAGPGVGGAAAPQAPWITPRLLRMAVANTHTNTCASPSRREGEVQWSPRESAWKPAPRLSALPAPPNARPASARLPRAGALELISMSLVSPRAARAEAPPRGEGKSFRGLRCATAPRHPPGSTRWS